jgi:hypothetical protein
MEIIDKNKKWCFPLQKSTIERNIIYCTVVSGGTFFSAPGYPKFWFMRPWVLALIALAGTG